MGVSIKLTGQLVNGWLPNRQQKKVLDCICATKDFIKKYYLFNKKSVKKTTQSFFVF